MIEYEFAYFSHCFITLFKDIAPFWGLGILMGSSISVFAKERIHGLLGAMRGARLGAAGEPSRHRFAALHVRNDTDRRLAVGKGHE